MSLLGDLFGDETQYSVDSPDACVDSRANNPLPSAPALRASHGFSGIYNQGATCYLNALLQTLVMTPEFRESLFNVSPSELGKLEDKDKPGAKVRVIPIQLQRLIARLMLLDVHAVKTTELTDSFGWTDNEERQQHDVQELNRILFSAIEDSLVETSGEKLIRNLYHGAIVNQIKCEGCGNSSMREEDFLDLGMTVSECSSLEDSLTISFVEKELLDRSNKYHCSICAKLTNAVKSARLRHLPPILTVSLLRFNFDPVKLERFKETRKFIFPTKLNMTKYCEHTGGSDFNADYELFSVVIHRGSTHGGHYHAYIRDVDCIGKWIHPDEEELHLLSSSSGDKQSTDLINCDSCHSLLKAILLKGDRKSGMSLDDLCAELLKETGASWNKRFKKQYGPITKFIKKYNDQFEYNQDSNWVSVKEQTGTSHQSVVDAADGNTVQGNNQNKKRKRTLSPPPDDGHCWFDFDDVHVHPISSKDIEKQFLGKESAYMLFYRNKSLVRPTQALHTSSYGIPEHVVCDIMKENAELDEFRMKHQALINKVSIEVHFGVSYTCYDGFLNPRQDSCYFLEFSIDKRQTVEEFLSFLMQEVVDYFPCDNPVIHIMKDVPSGIHLYRSITDDLSATLASHGIANNSKVFLWNGQPIDGHAVPTGANCEPILLKVVCSNACSFTCRFAKNLRVNDVKETISFRSGISMRNLHLMKLQDVGCSDDDEGSHVLEDDGKSLAELKLVDCSQLYAMDNSSKEHLSVPDIPSNKNQITFWVENRCFESKSENGWQTFSVKVDQESLVQELKAVILSQLDLDIDVTLTRLRIIDDGLGTKPTLYEHENLSTSGLKDGMKLFLERGQTPSPTEVMLFISIIRSGKVTNSLELLVEKGTTVGHLLELVIERAELETPDWHLCQMAWNGESGKILDDTELSLEGANIGHGHFLTLECGRLPPKGFLQLSVYLCSSPTFILQQTGFMQQLSTKLQEWLPFTNAKESSAASDQKTRVTVGMITISKLSTLLDLKEQIMTLDGMNEFNIPTPKFLRLSLLQSKGLGNVFRQHLQTLQKLKLPNVCDVGVQILMDEEDLTENQMLLKICLRCEDERKYLPEQELIWNMSQGATLQLLRKVVANVFQVPEHLVVIAKHVKEKYEWIVLSESQTIQKSSKQNNKHKKKGQTKHDLRHAPYNLSDADVIGVKVLQTVVTSNRDDFGTEEDDAGKERLEKDAEEIKQMRKENRKEKDDFSESSSTSKSKGRPELAIRIHVDRFS